MQQLEVYNNIRISTMQVFRRTTTQQSGLRPHCHSTPQVRPWSRRMQRLCATQAQEPKSQPRSEADETTEKYGLEAGLWKVMTSKEEAAQGDAPKVSRTEQAKQLLKQYGSAYLITSISFAVVSFALCYAAVNAGVDMGALLARIGLQVNDTSEKVGTFAVAYAAHKALSPVRFPPTVALTPVVAKWLGTSSAADKQQE